jgi:hypothetical protein
MTQLHFTETDGIGPSTRVWGKINCPHSSGYFRTRGEGNPAIGFFDDFLQVGNTSLYNGYILLQTATGTVVQIASTATSPGAIRLGSLADNDEAVIQPGAGLDMGPFRFQKDLAFEARVMINAAAIVADDHGFFIGMATGGAAGGAIANKLFSTGDVMAQCNHVGFQHLDGESTALDANYAVTSGTVMDGSQDTDLDTVHTLVADTWVKLGFTFRAARPRKLEWFVDGVSACSIGETEIAAAAFPDADAVFMQPTIGIRGADATSAYLDVDWMACAQLY